VLADLLRTPALVGRGPELERVDALIAAAAEGRSAALLVMGEPGIGKSALTAAARERAAERGFPVLQAGGVEAEADIAFAGLAELLAPVLDHLDRIPAAQARALRAALAIEPEGEAPAPFVVAAAVLSLLSAAAEDASGVLVVVDDAHWLDDESLGAILFATRRLHAEGVVVLISARPEPDRGLVARGLEQIDLAGLSEDDARALVRQAAADRAIAEGPLARIVATAAGNPLALTELPRTLAEDELGGGERLAEPVRPGAAVERAFETQIAALPEDTARALVVAAADETGRLGTIVDALRRLGLRAAALEPAERAGAIRAEAQRIRFRHPLLRSVAYHRAPGSLRREAHAALADVLGAEGDRGRRAWHLAEAATGPDESVAAELEASGADARARGALHAAAHALARAADLTPEDQERARRLSEAANDYVGAGALPAAVELSRRGLALGPEDAIVRGVLQGVEAEVALRSGKPIEARDMWIPAAESVADIAPERAAYGWLGIVMTERIVGNHEGMRRACERAAELAGDRDPVLRAFAEVLLAQVHLTVGEPERAEPLIARAEQVLAGSERPPLAPEVITAPEQAAMMMGRLDEAERGLSAVIAAAREGSAVTQLIFPLALRCLVHVRHGRFRSAYADGSEALQLAEDTQQFVHVALVGGMLAEAEAAMGHEQDCRAHAAQAIAIWDLVGAHASGLQPRAGLGLLDLGLGRLEAALGPLAECEQTSRAIGMPDSNNVAWAPNYVEALIRLGRRDEAAAAVGWLEAESANDWARASALRCRGMLAERDEEADELFERSAAAFEALGMPFETARTQLCRGERMRRSRRRGDAREPLRDALTRFERSAAAPWADRAREELRLTGEAVARDEASPAEELTGRELRIAQLVAEGRTNPEVAAELFVSRKTVEHHLSQIYRKLGLRSRTELARALAPELRDADTSATA
jgi:DNA-binding NarL/FixJ family response regulator